MSDSPVLNRRRFLGGLVATAGLGLVGLPRLAEAATDGLTVPMRSPTAKKLLTTTDLGLQEVAERSGFRTASALANLFKQRTGLTPRSYRAEHRQAAYQ